jgi:hypothetical protein
VLCLLIFHQVAQVEQLHEQLRNLRLPTWIAEHGELNTAGQIAGILSANIGSLQANGEINNAVLADSGSSPSAPD